MGGEGRGGICLRMTRGKTNKDSIRYLQKELDHSQYEHQLTSLLFYSVRVSLTLTMLLSINQATYQLIQHLHKNKNEPAKEKQMNV